jgi:diketogulonate reductase-like aldo/keto reductase
MKDRGRRAMIKALAVAGAAIVARRLTAAPERPAMRTRPIPSTGEPLPVIGVGTSGAFEVGGSKEDRAPIEEVLRMFVAAGARLVDTSPMYGTAEGVVGDVAASTGAAGKLFLATKVWTTGRAQGIEQMEESFRRLRASTIDLMQVHNLVDWRTHLKTLRAWKAQKKVRYIGITHYTVPGLDELAAVIRAEPAIDFVQFAYSINVRAAETRLLPLCTERGIATLVNQPFDSGDLFRKVRDKALPEWAAEIECASWGQIFLKYILGHPAVTCVIPGTAKPEHMRDNIGAGLGRLPDAAERKRMAEFWDGL